MKQINGYDHSLDVIDILIESYNFHNYKVNILENSVKGETIYHVTYNSETFTQLKNFARYEKELKNYLEEFIRGSKEFIPLAVLYDKIQEGLKRKKLHIPSEMIIPILFRVFKLEKIAPVLIDNEIDEIYLDSSESAIYIDHSRYGRCSTHIRLNREEIESFIYRVALENDFPLNRSNPTMKADFISPLFHTRVTVDIAPLTISDVHLDIRKFRSNSLKLVDLVKNYSLSFNQAIFLIFMIKNLVTISIIGPPNSGKTTLQNALIEYIPFYYRLLSIEDVLEMSNDRSGHNIRFRIGYDPLEAKILSKSLEIQKLLHRSPDFINMGELSLKDHFNAFLNVLSAGIPSIQTIHGRNPMILFYRLSDVYEIPLRLLKTTYPHVFVEMDVNWEKKRKIRSVVTLCELNKEGEIINIPEEKIDQWIRGRIDKTDIFSLEYLNNRKGVSNKILEEIVENFTKDLRQVVLIESDS